MDGFGKSFDVRSLISISSREAASARSCRQQRCAFAVCLRMIGVATAAASESILAASTPHWCAPYIPYRLQHQQTCCTGTSVLPQHVVSHLTQIGPAAAVYQGNYTTAADSAKQHMMLFFA
jgi:hypothetical protein